MKKITATEKSNNELVMIQRNDVYTNSWVIAERIGRQHRAITKHIKKFESDFKDLGTLFSYTASATKTRGEERKIYELNEAQAIFLMTLLGNDRIVVEFKKKLATQFVAMRKLLLEKQTAEWQETRLQSKQIRLQETDAIKQLIEYAKSQGSQNADKLYLTYSKLVKQLAGYDKRESSDTETLFMIMAFERTLFGVISSEMMMETPYKQIYIKAKQELTQLKLYWSRPMLQSSAQASQGIAAAVR